VTYGNHFANGYLERDWTGVGISPRFDFIIVHEARTSGSATASPAADQSDMWIHEAWATYSNASTSIHVGARGCPEVHQRIQIESPDASPSSPRAASTRRRAGHVLQGRALPHTLRAWWTATAAGGPCYVVLPALQVSGHHTEDVGRITSTEDRHETRAVFRSVISATPRFPARA